MAVGSTNLFNSQMGMAASVQEINGLVQSRRATLDRLYGEIERVIVGQRAMIDRLLIGLLAGGHVLLEGVPGLAKTLAVRCLAGGLSLTFRRIQFTPDLLPADVIGTQIYNPRTGEFTIRKGPIFSNLVLADEINRAPAKVQSALLEAMQEKQVTIGETSYLLEQPFLVFATQNPIEQEGTYPLPEAQVDRFMLKLKLTYPTKEEELAILDRMGAVEPDLLVEPVLTPGDILDLRNTLDQIYVDGKIKRYIVDVIHATRKPADHGLDLGPYVQYGASPRATIFLMRAAKGHAFLEGRGYVTPQDVKSIGYDVLRHRIIVTYEAEAEEISSENILQRIFDHLKVP
jgi:MoxR-like ATPase